MRTGYCLGQSHIRFVGGELPTRTEIDITTSQVRARGVARAAGRKALTVELTLTKARTSENLRVRITANVENSDDVYLFDRTITVNASATQRRYAFTIHNAVDPVIEHAWRGDHTLTIDVHAPLPQGEVYSDVVCCAHPECVCATY